MRAAQSAAALLDGDPVILRAFSDLMPGPRPDDNDATLRGAPHWGRKGYFAAKACS